MSRFKGKLRGRARDFCCRAWVVFFWNRVLFLCCKWQKLEVRIVKWWRLCGWQITGQNQLSFFNWNTHWSHYLRGSIGEKRVQLSGKETQHWKDTQKATKKYLALEWVSILKTGLCKWKMKNCSSRICTNTWKFTNRSPFVPWHCFVWGLKAFLFLSGSKLP